MKVLNISTDFIFMFDIFLNFRTSFIKEKTGEEIIIFKRIFAHYSTSIHFYLDLLAAIPF